MYKLNQQKLILKQFQCVRVGCVCNAVSSSMYCGQRYLRRSYLLRLWTLCQESLDSSCRCARAITLKPCLV